MAGFDEGGSSAKRDRGARLVRVASVLRAHPDGIRAEDLAERLGISRRTAYRDLVALEGELALPTWSDDGRWGILESAFLPPLKLTTSEAMAVFLATRLVVRYADKYDPDLAAAFEKLAGGLPAPLSEHVHRSLDVLQRAQPNPAFVGHVHALTRAWAERRVVEITYLPARYEGRPDERRVARVRPYLLEPSTQTHALYLIGWDLERDALRTFKVERISAVSVTLERFEPPEPGMVETLLRRAWDIIADQPPMEIELRFRASVAQRVAETIWHPSQEIERETDGSLRWRGTVAGPLEIRLWILSWGADVEVLAPEDLRRDVADRLAEAAAIYG